MHRIYVILSNVDIIVFIHTDILTYFIYIYINMINVVHLAYQKCTGTRPTMFLKTSQYYMLIRYEHLISIKIAVFFLFC